MIQDSNDSSGFSLVELLLVVGIIGLLVTFAKPAMNIFVIKARQTEAKTSLKMIDTLVKSVVAETGVAVDPCSLGAGGGWCTLSTGNISTSTSCNV